ncbi:MAG: hypothetical protein N3F63_08165 [Thermoplasmata archaeon]|nr:hypothetical protein [Thermoplasmata archaeon]
MCACGFMEVESRKRVEIINAASNVIAGIAGAFATVVSTLVERVIKFCNGMMVKAACSVLPKRITRAKEIVEIALKREWQNKPASIMNLNDLYSVFSSAMALVKYIKTMGCANIILKGIGLGTTSAALVMNIYQTYNDINEVLKEAKI